MSSEISKRHAIRLWTQRHSGTWGEANETELHRWLAENSEHREVYEKVRTAWALAEALKPMPSREPDLPPEDALAESSHLSVRASLFKRAVLAAGIVFLGVAIGIPVWHFGHRWWSGAEIQLTTLKGQPQTFSLDDGTTVTLDANSQLTANIGAHRRSVCLNHGDAFFNVKHDESRPFEVATAAGRVQDLGTRFDIEVLENSTRVAVIEGRVAILTRKGPFLLLAGQAGGYDNTGELLATKPLKWDETGWSEGQRYFDQELLGDVLERVARYHGVKFVFTDSRLRELRVSGTFRIGDLPLFLRTLAAALPIEPRHLDTGQIAIASR